MTDGWITGVPSLPPPSWPATPVGVDGWRTTPTPPWAGTLSDWLEANMELPEGSVAVPGPLRLWSYQREICDCIGDDVTERVTVLKSARIGYTQLLTGALAYFMKERTSNILIVLPCESDCRDYMVSDIEATFAASPKLEYLLPPPSRNPIERSRICHRIFEHDGKHGSLRIVSARAPRNLRRLTVKYLIMDEIDAFAFGSTGHKGEGDSVRLAEKRTLSFSPRKIISGSTPLFADVSGIVRRYAQSDMRIFEVPCPHCGAYSEITWATIAWTDNDPETAKFRCIHCNELIDERHKPQMVNAGHWRATAPHVKGHAGFKLNSLISLLPNCSWSNLVREFLEVKNSPEELRVFINTILGEPFNTSGGDELNEDTLAARAERFDLEHIPAEVLALTCGVDTQHDRLECTITGWTRTNDCLVLEHRVLFGDPNNDNDLWSDLDDLLLSRFKHPNGGRLKIDATVIDCADGATHNKIVSFTTPRTSRKVLAGRGAGGFSRPPIARSQSKAARAGKQVWIVGVDALKLQLFNKLTAGRSIRFSDTLPAEWYAQLTSERRIVRFSRGQPKANFERKQGARAEALDCIIYATAARAVVNLAVDTRERELASVIPPTRAAPSVIRSAFMDAGRN